jgi:hypothetical protein
MAASAVGAADVASWISGPDVGRCYNIEQSSMLAISGAEIALVSIALTALDPGGSDTWACSPGLNLICASRFGCCDPKVQRSPGFQLGKRTVKQSPVPVRYCADAPGVGMRSFRFRQLS